MTYTFNDVNSDNLDTLKSNIEQVLKNEESSERVALAKEGENK